MKSLNEIIVRINELKETRNKYLEVLSKGPIRDVDTFNYTLTTCRLETLRWVIQSSTPKVKKDE